MPNNAESAGWGGRAGGRVSKTNKRRRGRMIRGGDSAKKSYEASRDRKREE